MKHKVYKQKPYRPKRSWVKTAKLIKREEAGDLIKLSFSYGSDIVDKVKSLDDRKFYKTNNEKYWTCPPTINNIKKLIKWNFHLSPSLIKLQNKQTNKKPHATLEEIRNIVGLRKELMRFQTKGVFFIDKNDGNALLADEQGLGKTIQSLAWLQMHPEKRPVIIVVPASVKLNWLKEAHDWMSHPKVQILYGTDSNLPLLGKIIIINYDILSYWVKSILTINPQVLITDECQYYKNNTAKRTKAVLKLGKKIPHVIALSGTPIVNRPIEFFNVIKLLSPYMFPSRFKFGRRYCDAKHNGFGWDFSGSSNELELHNLLTNSFMIRRLKKNVLKELPDKIYSHIPIEIDNRKEYEEAENDFISFIKKQSSQIFDIDSNNTLNKLKNELGEFMEKYGIKEYDFGTHQLSMQKAKKSFIEKKVNSINILTEIEVLKQLAVKGKMNHTIKWIQDVLDTGEKLVVFGIHKFVIDMLMQEFGKIAVKIDGSVPVTKRQKIVNEFQTNNKIRLFVGNIKAAGVGLTLTAASNVAIIEYPWSPGNLAQCPDRLHRIGQKDTVNVNYLAATNTIEDKIANLLDEKQKMLDAVLDGKSTEQTSILSDLLKLYH